MRVFRRILLLLLVLVVIAGVAGYWYQRPMLRTGTGYAAHNACAVELVAGRTDASNDLPPNPLVPVLRSSTEGAHTTASILGLLAKQHAWFAEDFGCTVAPDAPELPVPAAVYASNNPYANAPDPEATDSVVSALYEAFGSDLSNRDQEALGTRAIVVLKDCELV